MDDLNTTPHTPPVVYLGPSAPEADIRAWLPGAVIRPPVRRDDLYRDRLMRFSVFVVIDGVFAQEDAISPREVVDVLQDGAAVIGASSMGALRAADCAPAGAEGVGLVHRLFAQDVLNSEDEVAVLFNPDNPYPALSTSLVSMRVALRRAVRAGHLEVGRAEQLATAAAALHFSDRSWRNVAQCAGLAAYVAVLATLRASVDVKRADAQAAAAFVARRIAANPDWALRPRKSRGTFGLLGDGRERAFDLFRGADAVEATGGFTDWIYGSGRGRIALGVDETLGAIFGAYPVDRSGRTGRDFAEDIEADIGRNPVPDDIKSEELLQNLRKCGALEVEWLKYLAVAQAAGTVVATPTDIRQAEQEITENFGASDWSALPEDDRILSARDKLGQALAWRRTRFSRS